MFILSSISSGLKIWPVNHMKYMNIYIYIYENSSVYENSELKVFKNIIFFGESLILLIIVVSNIAMY